METRNVVRGLSAMSSVALLSKLLIPNMALIDTDFRLALQFLLGALAGTLVAHGRFLLPALGAWLYFWCCYTGIASANGQTLLGVFTARADAMMLTAGAVICGVLLVQSLFVMARSALGAT